MVLREVSVLNRVAEGDALVVLEPMQAEEEAVLEERRSMEVGEVVRGVRLMVFGMWVVGGVASSL